MYDQDKLRAAVSLPKPPEPATTTTATATTKSAVSDSCVGLTAIPYRHHSGLYATPDTAAAAAATTFSLQRYSSLFPPPPPPPLPPQLGPTFPHPLHYLFTGFPTAPPPPRLPPAYIAPAHPHGTSCSGVVTPDPPSEGPGGNGGGTTTPGWLAGRGGHEGEGWEGGRGGGGGGGESVLVHWKQSGGSSAITSSTNPPGESRSRHHSVDEDDDDLDDGDGLLAPAPPRERLSYTRYQLELMNGIFHSIRYPNALQKQLIGRRVGISKEQVKIWFQNRRRKDVVSHKAVPPSTSSSSSSTTTTGSSTPTTSDPLTPNSPSSPIAASPSSSQQSDKGTGDDTQKPENQDEGSAQPRHVSYAIIKGIIAELSRFTDEKIKERKQKRKARGKRRAQAGVRPAMGGSVTQFSTNGSNLPTDRLFQAYDIVAPPNQITPTATAAYFNTERNRFSHSHQTSAFSSPRDHLALGTTVPRYGLDTGLSQSLMRGGGSQLPPSTSYGLGLRGLGVGGQVPASLAHRTMGLPGTQGTLAVLSDLLMQQQESSRALLSQAYLSSSSSSSRLLADSLRSAVHDAGANNNSPSAVPALDLNQVYPYPTIADHAGSLASIFTRAYFSAYNQGAAQPPLPPYHFNSLSMANNVYNPLGITPLSNPYCSEQNPPFRQRPPVPGAGAVGPSHGNGGLPQP